MMVSMAGEPAEESFSSPFVIRRNFVLQNRIVKAATAEKLATDQNNGPTQYHLNAYERWGKAGYGMIITGNVQVDPRFLGDAGDVVAPSPDDSRLEDVWKEWARRAEIGRTPSLVQLCHPGPQSMRGNGTRGLFEQTLAPSAIPLNFGPGILAWVLRSLAFGTPKAMSLEEIQSTIKMFIDAAKTVEKAGFQGVELHGAHGYLISLFLSPKFNQRNDHYGGSPQKRLNFIKEIINGIREAVSSNFILGVKLNSVDYMDGGSEEEEVYDQIKAIASYGVDFIEISGGSYENPVFAREDSEPSPQKENTSAPVSHTTRREAYFVDFATKVRAKVPEIPLMVTGGFKSRGSIRRTIDSGACDMVGVARAAIMVPEFPKLVMNGAISDDEAVCPEYKVTGGGLKRKIPIKSIGAGLTSLWHSLQIHRIGRGSDPDPTLSVEDLQKAKSVITNAKEIQKC